MKLLIVESPGKIKKIQSFLGDDWKVTASIGHVRDLPKNDTGVYPPDFKPQYVPTERGKKVIDDLKLLVAKSDSVWLATDPDREGEAIAWHLQETLKLNSPHRVTYTEITEQAIKKALEQPRKIDLNLVRAQEGRRVLDRLVGYSVSPALGTVSGQILSAGRVQTPALRLVVERELTIRNFRQTTHYGVELTFDRVNNVSDGWKAVWNTKNILEEGQEFLLDKALAEKVARLHDFNVASYTEGESRQSPPSPFTTSTLQQAASNTLKLDPKETMAVAQKLYENGLITYMRTDSPNLSEEAIVDIRSLASKNDWPVPAHPRKWKSKEGAQEAHEAIRPTHIDLAEAGDSESEKGLYRLIWQRAVASQLDDAVFATVKAVLKTEMDGQEVIFDAKGRRLIAPGWKVLTEVDQADETKSDSDSDKDNDELNNQVPKLREGSHVTASSGEVKTKKTSAPPRYTQAALIRELEKRGIGRPSTYAAIMDNISTRKYIETNPKRQILATQLGEELLSYVNSKFEFVDYDYTKIIENSLDDIAAGKTEYLTVIQEVYDRLTAELSAFMLSNSKLCPDCGQPLRHLCKNGKDSYNYWVCTNKDNCNSKFNDNNGEPGEKRTSLALSEYLCEDCKKPLRHIIKEGPEGYNFWGCSDRSCSATYKDMNGKPGEKNIKKEKAPPSKFKCSACKSPLYHRKGHSDKTGKDYDFFVCSNKLCKITYSSEGDKPVLKGK